MVSAVPGRLGCAAMTLSVFDMFRVGIGPSSSHTVGPMLAAGRFASRVVTELGEPPDLRSLRVELFGSLGQTGRGHGTGPAVLLGLEGADPATVEPDLVPARAAEIADTQTLRLLDRIPIPFDPNKQLVFHRRKTLPFHPNGMRFTANDGALEAIFYSVGGGFVVDDSDAGADRIVPDQTVVEFPFASGDELLAVCERSGLSVASLMLRNEMSWRSRDEIVTGLNDLCAVMHACITRGCEREGILPGGLRVRRRAAGLHRRLKNEAETGADPLAVMDWVSLFALAVNEENAAGGRVVTAPTNGAAGIIPAVLEYYRRYTPNPDEEGIARFLLTAGAIGTIYTTRASISGAEVGCQGEVGVACSMAAAGLCEAMGGTPAQVENAAEIGMEHNLGLTCDPVGGLVQVPCIERNAMGAIKAINAARMAMRGDGTHHVSLDKVIETMRQTGADMKTKYKETARGGLAVNVIEC
jgi:L-serine dehydratase